MASSQLGIFSPIAFSSLLLSNFEYFGRFASCGKSSLFALCNLPFQCIFSKIYFAWSYFELSPELEKWYRSEEHTSELQSRQYLVCRLLLEKKKINIHRL